MTTRRSNRSTTRSRRDRHGRQLLTVFLGLLALPLLIKGGGALLPLLEDFTAKAVFYSAAVNLPDGSIALLEKRFNRETFDEEDFSSDDFTSDLASESSTQSGGEGSSSSQSASQSQSSSTSESVSQSQSQSLPEIPAERQGKAVTKQYTATAGGINLPFGNGLIKNSTELSADTVLAELEKPLELALDPGDEPQVLIFHTHATESFEPYGGDVYDTSYSFRSDDDSVNTVHLGDIITQILSDAGIGVLHDTTHHDASYNGAYDRSAATVKSYLEKYPSIKVVLDVHRDAIQPEEGVILRPVAEINGREAAQVMIISGCDDGTMNMPNYFSNLRFAAALQSTMEGMYPGLTRPVFFCYRKYNMDLSPGALLIELGSHGNTLEQVSYSAELVGNALVSLLKEQTVSAE